MLYGVQRHGSNIMTYKIIIPGELTDLNTYIKAERTNKHIAAKIKKNDTETVRLLSRLMPKVEKQIIVKIIWYTKDSKKDPDNVAFAKKFILDGLVLSKVLKNDGRKQIKAFEDCFEVDKLNPRIEVELIEVE